MAVPTTISIDIFSYLSTTKGSGSSMPNATVPVVTRNSSEPTTLEMTITNSMTTEMVTNNGGKENGKYNNEYLVIFCVNKTKINW